MTGACTRLRTRRRVNDHETANAGRRGENELASNATVNSVLPWSIPAGVNTVVVNGYPMAYQDTGIGEPVVLVHGALLDYRFWCAQVPEFSRRYRVISLSLRHYYPEAWDGKGGGFSILEHADDVAELINVLELGRVHLLGQSRGGAVAVNVAKRHPELIKTLTLADASGLEALLPDTPESAKLAAQVKQLASNLRKRIAAGQIAEGAEEFIDAISGPGAWAKVPRERQQIFLDNVGTAAVDTGERPRITCADIVKFDSPSCWSMVVNGERSLKRYGEMFAAMRTCKPTIPRVVIIPSAAHGMNVENPAAFNAAVLEFLAHN
jgi:pimeloyl-ACP methyl ester carboxylesterase